MILSIILYDSNGNLTKWTDDPEGTPVVKEFLWDDLNRLTKIVVDSNDEAIFIYDVNNQRVRKEYDSDDDGDIDTDDDIIAYVWANGHVIEEYVNPADAGYSLDRNYVHGNQFVDELVLFEDSSGDYHYYLQDFRYTVYALVDDTGTIEERYRFDPYGKRTVVTDDGSIDEHYGFTGRYHDDSDETDLVYFRNRWFSPEMGRFVSRDLAEYEDGMNLYAGWFVADGTDPLGMQTFKMKKCTLIATLKLGVQYRGKGWTAWRRFLFQRRVKIQIRRAWDNKFKFVHDPICCKCKEVTVRVKVIVEHDEDLPDADWRLAVLFRWKGDYLPEKYKTRVYPQFRTGATHARSVYYRPQPVWVTDPKTGNVIEGPYNQVPIAHEAGHMLGYYKEHYKPGPGHIKDFGSLMGAGMRLRPSTYQAIFASHIEVKGCPGPWKVKVK